MTSKTLLSTIYCHNQHSTDKNKIFPSIAFYFDMHILLPTVLLWGLKIIAYLQFKCFCIMYFVEKLPSNISQTSFYQICVYFSLYTYLLSGNKTICKLLFLYKTGLLYYARNKILYLHKILP